MYHLLVCRPTVPRRRSVLLVVPKSIAISVFPTPKPFPNFLQPAHLSSRVRLVFASMIFFTAMARDNIKTLIIENSLWLCSAVIDPSSIGYMGINAGHAPGPCAEFLCCFFFKPNWQNVENKLNYERSFFFAR